MRPVKNTPICKKKFTPPREELWSQAAIEFYEESRRRFEEEYRQYAYMRARGGEWVRRPV